jgi:hypothetical protein
MLHFMHLSSGLALLCSIAKSENEQHANAVKWSTYKASPSNYTDQAWQIITATLRAEISMQLSISNYQSNTI